MSLEIQLITAAGMLGVGFLLGAGYDVIQASRKVWRTPSWVQWVSDLLFWGVGTWVTFKMLFHLNGGILRPYFLGFLFAGSLGYYLFLHQTIVKLYQGMLSLIWRVVKSSFLLLYRVILFPLRLLYACLIMIVGAVFWFFTGLTRIVLGPLRWIASLLWRGIKQLPGIQRWTDRNSDNEDENNHKD
ncbi:spore cortex biosynthesis protein YabQ [Rubeoparvulum massiliense]|uniref:spore cortex biosynthesis protein YabQ n=1 Tax=Rubeoparvulum massiliense TaxID=1631346 RepID=UPI00065E7B85|nr:spore cortex biosynthesis protein YabQ [Rubeoparvulum massiliense]